MDLGRTLGVLVLSLAAAVGVGAVERVEIVVDNSAEMWRTLGDGPPRFVGVRTAMLDYAAGSLHRQGRPEVALRTIGGSTEPADPCLDTELALPFAVIDPRQWFETTTSFAPRGGRPLAAALHAAKADLANAPDRRRIVLVVGGSTDDCRGDVIGALRAITSADPPIELRIIGLGLDRPTASAASQLAPTRNLYEINGLGQALQWALQPADTRPAVPAQFEISMTMEGTPTNRADVLLYGPPDREPVQVLVRNGSGRARIVPGRYRATVAGIGVTHELAGLVFGTAGDHLSLDLAVGPRVTLVQEPERPSAGGSVLVRIWGAPTAGGWVTVSTPEAAIDEFLIQVPVAGDSGHVEMRLPDTPGSLELRFLAQAAPGVVQLVGRAPLETESTAVVLDAPEEVEIRTPLTIGWTGPGNVGDRISVALEGAPTSEHVNCVYVSSAFDSATLPAPVIPGRYVIRYSSPWGRILEQRRLEAFEILATLDAEPRASPAAELAVEWTGPGEPEDFLSIAVATDAAETYISWAPANAGSPGRLMTPPAPGTYEIRYVRGLDGQVLARRPIEVVRSEITIQSPQSVEAGTRFEVRYRGTADAGDLVVVARVASEPREWLDFAFVDDDPDLSLAAPFSPGRYEVRYLSGTTFEIRAARPLRVR